MENKEQQFTEKLIHVNRVTKVVKGGRIMGFAALMIVGDGNGQIGMGKGKSKEVPIAVKKAVKEAHKNLVQISLNNGTVHHSVKARHGSTQVFLYPAKEGTGIIAGGAMRAMFDALGVRNITAKVHGSTNPYNVVLATLKALQAIYTPHEIALKRGKTVEQILEG